MDTSPPRAFGRDFYLYLASRFCGATAMTMFRSTVAWHVFDLTGSAFHLGLIGLVQFVPALGLSLVAGAVADGYDRRRILQAAQVVELAVGSVLLLEIHRGASGVGPLYAAVFVIAAVVCFQNPARAALLPSLVPRVLFPRAVTVASTNQALAFIVGPAAGGLTIAAAGVAAAYAFYLILVVVSLAALSWMRSRGRPEGVARVSLRAILEGLAFVRRRQVLLGCMALDMFAVIFGGAGALLPIYANEILDVGPRGYGLLTSSLETGALASSLALALLPPIRRSGRALLIAVGAYGLATVAFGLSRSFPLSLAAYMAVGVADQVSVVMRSTIIQLATPDELRGRVSSVNFLFIGASNQLGAVESGFVAAATSAPFAVVSGGVGCLVVLALVALKLPELRRYRAAT
jgi:MFS family permease